MYLGMSRSSFVNTPYQLRCSSGEDGRARKQQVRQVLLFVFETQIPNGVFVSLVLFFLGLFGDVFVRSTGSLLLKFPQLLDFLEDVLFDHTRDYRAG